MRRITALLLVGILTFYAGHRNLSANEGTIPEPVLPILFHDIVATLTGEVVSIQLGISDWDLGVTQAELHFLSLSAGDSITLTYGSTDTIYSTANTTWLVNELHAAPGTYQLRQVYAQDGSGRELNLFFMDGYSFVVPFLMYFPQVSN